MQWPTKKETRVSLVAAVLGTLAGSLLPEHLRESAQELLDALSKLFVLL